MGINRAIRDARRFITNGGFNVSITLTPNNGGDDVVVQGVTSRHNIEFDQEGYPINSTNAHVVLVESVLTEAGITVRNGRDEVALEGFLMSYIDGTGTSRTYKIVETRPSETFGLIICIMGRYGTN